MGTDIHGVFQRHNGSAWEDIPSTYDQDRDYQLFAVLAGVRNGYGFAGIPIGEVVKPIAEPRGLPDDFEEHGSMHPLKSLEHLYPSGQRYHDASEPLEAWMGDHSYSWLTGAEMLSWFDTAPSVVKVGVIDRAQYEAWDKKSEPATYCGDVYGMDIVKINDNEVEKAQTPGWTHIRCHWDRELRQSLAYFFDEVKRLVDQHGYVRFVFGFDS